MISLFIFKSNAKGTLYGIGTYIRQITNSLLIYSDLKIFIVNYSGEYKEFTIKPIAPNLTELHIPQPGFNFTSAKQVRKFAKRIVDLLVEIIQQNSNPIFLVNYPESLQIVKELKSRISSPVISIIHSAEWQMLYNGNKQRLIQVLGESNNQKDLGIIRMNFECELYDLSDYVISVTNYMKDFLVNFYKIPESKIAVVQNGIDNADFQIHDKQKKNQMKYQLGFNPDEKILLYSGRIDLAKGFIFLLQGFSKVVEQNNNVRLVIIGEVAGLDEIRAHFTNCENIWSRIQFTGFLDYKKILKFYQIADVGIIPSVYDHCPYVALEMMGHNIPIIVSNTEGLNEILSKNQSIYLTPVYDKEGNIRFDSKEIAEAILSLVDDEEKAKHITRDYPELIRTRFSGKRMAREIYSVLKRLSAVAVET